MKFLIAALAALAIGLGVAQADHSWSTYHWRSDNLAPTVQDKTSTALYDVTAAVSEWSALGTPIQPTLTTRKGKVTVSEAYSVFWLGLARIFIDDEGHITKGEVKLNTAALESYGPDAADHVLCQEIGHILGLDHQIADSCMNDSLATLGQYTTPNAHDAEQLSTIYNHTDQTDRGRRGPQRNGWVIIDTIPIQ